MFTLKFQVGEESTVVCGKKYHITSRFRDSDARSIHSPYMSLITVHEKLDDPQGVDFTVGSNNEEADGILVTGYDVCFIENQNGKTIDRIGPFRDSTDSTDSTDSNSVLVTAEKAYIEKGAVEVKLSDGCHF